MAKMTVRTSKAAPIGAALRGAGLYARMTPAVFVAAGSFGTATAQEVTEEAGSGVLAEVIVTAQKRAERMIDIPMSISALSAENMAVAGVDNALDLSLAAPGLAAPGLAALEFGPGMQALSIRGISSIRGSSTLIGVYLDEMPVTGMQATGNTPDAGRTGQAAGRTALRLLPAGPRDRASMVRKLVTPAWWDDFWINESHILRRCLLSPRIPRGT